MSEQWVFPEWMEPHLPWLSDEAVQENRLSVGLVTRLMNHEDLVCDKGSISPTIRICARVDLLQRLHDEGYLVDPAQGVEVEYDPQSAPPLWCSDIANGWNGCALGDPCTTGPKMLAKRLVHSKPGKYRLYAVPVHEADGEEGE